MMGWNGFSPLPSISRDRRRIWTMIMVNLAAILERADEQVLPSTFKWISRTFRASPEQLSFIQLSRALVQGGTSSSLLSIMDLHYTRSCPNINV